jgi:hypothetical protein
MILGSVHSREKGIVSSLKCPDHAWGPLNLLVRWIPGVLSPLVKWLGRELIHSLPSDTEFKNEWRYTSTPPVCLLVVDRDNLIVHINYKF